MRRAAVASLLGLALFAPPTKAYGAPPAEPGFSLLGSGLLTLPDTATVAPGRFTLGLTLDNKDRDPLGLDLLDYSVGWTFGIVPGLEAYGHHVLSRVVAMPEPPALPPPPLDLIVAPGAREPTHPYYALYSGAPYVNKRGSDRFDSFLPGDFVFGLKHRLREADGPRPALALAAQVTAPLTQSVADLQAGAGTGGLELTGRLIAEWRAGDFGLVASVAFAKVGGPRFGDRIVRPGSGTTPGSVREKPLELPDRAEIAVGVRRSLSARLAAVAEASAIFEVGPRTATLDRAWPLDALAGLQVRWGGSRWTVGLRYHGHGLPSGQARASPLAGAIDLSAVGEDERRSWLEAAGLDSAVAGLRPGAQVVLIPGPLVLPALPEGSRVVPAQYLVRSEHQVGFVIAWGWTF